MSNGVASKTAPLPKLPLASGGSRGLPPLLSLWPAIAAAGLAVQAALSLALQETTRLTAYNNILHFFVLLIATCFAAGNALRSNQAIRLFWIFLASGLGLWAVNPLSWVYYVLIVKQESPDIVLFSPVLFLHTVLIVAAVAVRPHLRTASDRPYRTTLNLLLLLLFWVFLYLFLMLPYQGTHPRDSAFRFVGLYLAENISLAALLGFVAFRARSPWKSIYLHLLGATFLYAIASFAVNLVFVGQGVSPGWMDMPYTAACCWITWVVLKGAKLGPELAQSVELEIGDERYASIPAAVAVICIPLIGIVELFRAEEPYERRVARLLVVMIFFVGIAAAVSIHHYVVKRHLASDVGFAQYLLRLAMQSGKAVVWEVDLRTGQSSWTGGLSALFGIPADSASGTSEEFQRYVHPEDRDRFADVLEGARRSGDPFATEFRIVRQNGAVGSVSANGRYYYSPSGAPVRMVGMIVDITDRKAAEEAVRKSEEKFSKAFRESPLAMCLTSLRDHRYIEVNETFELLSGWKREEIIGRTPFDLDIWVNPEQRGEFARRLLAEGSIRNLDTEFRTKNGEIRKGMGSGELIEFEGEPCALSVIADITEMRRAEEARLLSERRFIEFFATLPEYCYLTSPAGRILDANPAACNALGYTKDEIRGKPLADIYAPESQSKMGVLLEEWKKTGEIHNQEMVIVTKQGQRRTVLLNAGAIRDATGNLLHSASVQVDITDRKKILEKLQESESRLEGIVASAMDAIIAIDEQQRIIVFNTSAEKMFHCPAGLAIGKSITDFIPLGFPAAQGAEVHSSGQADATGGGKGTLGALWGLRASGEEFPIEASISQTTTDGKRFFTGIIRDITERFRAESAVRESEERFRLVANAAPVLIWMSGTDRLCDYFNQPWLEFTGRILEQELGNGWAEGVHPDDLQRCLETYARAFDRREPFEMEYRLRRHDGAYRWIRDYGVPRFSAGGSFAGYIGSCHDVTDHKRAAEALSTVSRRLIEAHEEERTWVARELHDDINQRVAMLAVNLERLKKELSRSKAETRHLVQQTFEQVSQLGSEIQSLSHRLHSSKLEYLGLAAAAEAFCREFCERQKLKIEFRCEGVPKFLPPEVSLCLFRVLQEAVQNAAKHSQSDRFQVLLTGARAEIVLTVRDSGVGFDLKAALQGRGLGLTSMKERLKLVDGELTIDAQFRKGTVIRASVPLRTTAASMQAAS